MRERTGPNADPASGVETVPWVVTDVRVLPEFALAVRFADGCSGTVDVRELIFAPTAGVFMPLRDPARFAEARVEDGAVTWPSGLDLAPDAMHAELVEHGHWRVPPFAAAR